MGCDTGTSTQRPQLQIQDLVNLRFLSVVVPDTHTDCGINVLPVTGANG